MDRLNPLAPVVLFAYDRPEHLRMTLKALSQNTLANQSELFIYCDGPKDNAKESGRKVIDEVRKIAREQLWCKQVHVIESERNKGLANSIIDGVTDIVNRYGKVIVLEDDLVTSPGFLKYMNDALELYQDDERVMHVTGYMFPVGKKLPETFFYEVPHCWGWGTWARSWAYFSNDIDEIYGYWSSRWNEFNKWGGDDLQRQLTNNYTGKLNTWFVKWHAAVLRRNGLTLYPCRSLVNNIGWDGTGDNCRSSTKYIVTDMPDSIHVSRSSITESRKAAHAIRVFQAGHWYSKRYRNKVLNRLKGLFHSKP